MRSLLFCPGDSPAKMAKALGSPADAVILDLEDSVAEARKPEARRLVAQFLGEQAASAGPRLWVRINPLDTELALADLTAVVPGRPGGIVLPKPDSAADVIRLDHYLSALEAACGAEPGRILILPIATETPAALFSLNSYVGASARLAGLTWGAEDLPTALGATANRTADGAYTPVCEFARSLCLAGAAAARVPAIETVYADYRDLDGVRAYAERGRRDGFTGMLAIHPAQVAIINEVFTPSAEEVARARRIIAAFEAAPDAGAVGVDGQMLDAPHLKQARRVLARAAGQRSA